MIYRTYYKENPMNYHNYKGHCSIQSIKFVEEIIRNQQCRFESRKFTIDHIFTFKQLIDNHELNKLLHLLFANLKQVYNRINREAL